MRAWMLCFLIAVPALGAPAFDYSGEMDLVQSSGGPCDSVFVATEYGARFIVTGQTAVLNLRAAPEKGFLDGTYVGLWGYSNDFGAEKSFDREGYRYSVKIEGIATFDLLYAKIKVTASEAGIVVCKASAEYTGFR